MDLNDLPCNPIELTPKATLIDPSRLTIRQMRKGSREIKNPLYRKTRKSRG